MACFSGDRGRRSKHDRRAAVSSGPCLVAVKRWLGRACLPLGHACLPQSLPGKCIDQPARSIAPTGYMYNSRDSPTCFRPCHLPHTFVAVCFLLALLGLSNSHPFPHSLHWATRLLSPLHHNRFSSSVFTLHRLFRPLTHTTTPP
jgi:hypothetical protein